VEASPHLSQISTAGSLRLQKLVHHHALLYAWQACSDAIIARWVFKFWVTKFLIVFGVVPTMKKIRFSNRICRTLAAGPLLEQVCAI
jgi:hypothetical protein